MAGKFEIIDLLLVSPLLALFLASLVPLTIKVLRKNQEQNHFATVVWALMGVIGAVGLMVATSEVRKLAFSKALIFDGTSILSGLLVCLALTVTLVFSRGSFSTAGKQFSEHVFLLLNAAIGMILVAWSNDLIVLFIGIEYFSLCLYILIALSHEVRLSKEAAFKYFVLGSFASAILLFGISFIFGSMGHTYINEMAETARELISTNRIFLFGLFMLMAGLAFKVALFPFHAWAPDVYQGSPTSVTAFMATGVKLVTFVAILRLVATESFAGERAGSFVSVLQWIAVLSMMAGNIGAILQNNLKRMLAYSSIAHSGYAMMGVLAAMSAGQQASAASSVLFYLVGYTFMTLGSFGIVGLMERDERSLVSIDDLKGYGRRHPWLAFCLSLFLLSLAGIPPTIGFFGKFFVFSAALSQGLFWLVFWGILSSVISVYFYLRPLVMMYMYDETGEALPARSQWGIVAVSCSAIAVIAGGLMADPVYRYVLDSVTGLF